MAIPVKRARQKRAAAPRVPRLREIDIQLACVDFMALDGWRPLRTDPCSDRRRGKGFGQTGMADHLFLRYPDENPTGQAWAQAEVLWVEFKRPAGFDAAGRWHGGTKPFPDQINWHNLERGRGARTAIASLDFEATYEGFIAWYRHSGLLRRAGL